MLECADQHQWVCLNNSQEEPSNDDEDENIIGTVEQNEETRSMHYNTDINVENNAILPCSGQSSRNITRNVPNYLKDFVLYSAKETGCAPEVEKCKIPTTVKEALASNEGKTQTWDIVTKTAGVKLITSRLLCRKKKDETRNSVKFKTRLVGRGYLQVTIADFNETFSPVIKLESIRKLLAIAAEIDFDVYQRGITVAYLNRTLEEDIYMVQPEGCIEKGKEYLACYLKKSLYGHKQSGSVCGTPAYEFLTQYDLRRKNTDPCIYYNSERRIIIGMFVADFLIIGRIQEIWNFKR
ncbi:Retrovirus-related Pol polyprotein from transposon TNT 1-94 [Araneus ventricosus]|uniref:Retrovirus-related Pol polyprotein from transposon TNT 1-94 n=1 Tax=Araneus ventricosus TaxID=182803 RepID=A0A4Y2DV84_ARAVE|nr:Retrovirus-related Pol polyprotein from transposon TNT 1-94 [Araneus ventricosus]